MTSNDGGNDGARPAPKPRVLINEVNANVAKSCDLVELRVLSAGTLGGFALWARTAPLVTFGELRVEPNDLIVVHLNADECAPGAKDEITSPSASRDASAFAGAYDWYSTAAGLVNTDNVITLYDADGAIVDAALFSDDPTGTAAAASEQQAQRVAAEGQWRESDGGTPATGYVDEAFNRAAVQDLNATGTSPSGESLQRVSDADTNCKADFSQGPSSWGKLNHGQGG